MNSLKKIMMVALVVLAITQSNAQINNAKTEVVKVYGNCGMCKKTLKKQELLKV